MSYSLGTKSRAKLQGVKPELVRVVERAIGISAQDFGVHEGLRSIETQRAYMARGVTRTVTVHFREGAVRHKRTVNACHDATGKYDVKSTRARVAQVAAGVAQKIALGVIA